MSNATLTKSYYAPLFCEKEILRYSGCRSTDPEVLALVDECIKECKDKLTYKVCYSVFNVKITDDVCDFGAFRVTSKDLAKNLCGCSKAVIFAATVGVGIDRLISKYSRISPSKALILQAIGAERIEALCDEFCTDIAKEMKCRIKPRFSAGYGDLSLFAQKDIFSVIDCSKHIGVSLNNSLLMSPSKSVTAFVGLCN